MSEQTDAEKLRTNEESRDAVASRPEGSGTGARREAMERYLSAEAYHDTHEGQAGADESVGGGDA